jgi:lipopolysaccharide export system permease protein
VIFGFGFYVANQVFGPMILVYDVPPIIGATGPSLLFMALAFYLLKRRG